MDEKYRGIGKSSFGLIDTKRLFSLLDLKKNFVFIDLACGRGEYSIAASLFAGEKGRIYALDRWVEGVQSLKKTTGEKGINSILPIQADISKGLPLANRCADICLLAAVFHDLLPTKSHEQTMVEVRRILKLTGVLAVIDFKKVAGPPGPAAESKISPEELEKLVRPHGFHQESTREIGRHHYVSLFVRHRIIATADRMN